MAEGTPDAMILISISWQALKRLELGQVLKGLGRGFEETEVCDCAIVLLFAGFFIEANLNYIIEELNQANQMKKFLNNKKYPGLQDKLAWFYNEYVSRVKEDNLAENKKELYKKLRRKFRGFSKIYKFRNDISHGVVDKSVTNPECAKILRQQAKIMVEKLFEIVKNKTGHDLQRNTDYQTAINS